MTTNEQLELGFKGIQRRAQGGHNADRMARAAWWFAEMRRIVANAMEWPASEQPQARQTWFTNTGSK